MRGNRGPGCSVEAEEEGRTQLQLLLWMSLWPQCSQPSTLSEAATQRIGTEFPPDPPGR